MSLTEHRFLKSTLSNLYPVNTASWGMSSGDKDDLHADTGGGPPLLKGPADWQIDWLIN